jgi:iron-sulfur cluster repair protein YtfE (RIC family)
MTDFTKLRDDHSKLMDIVRRLRLLIGWPKPPAPLHLFAVRQELSPTLIGHLKVEDWVVYPSLVGSPNSQVARTARAFCEEMGSLADDYRDHCAKWTAAEIAQDWPGYCADCREILDALAVRIARENNELYPLVESSRRAA